MLAMASKARGDRLSVGAMKLPAALFTRPVRPPPSEQGLHHLLHRLGHADVHAEGVDAAAGKALAPGCRGFVAHGLAAAADGDVGAQREEAFGHGLAQAGAAAGDQDALAGEQLRCVHGIPRGHRARFAAIWQQPSGRPPRTLQALGLEEALGLRQQVLRGRQLRARAAHEGDHGLQPVAHRSSASVRAWCGSSLLASIFTFMRLSRSSLRVSATCCSGCPNTSLIWAM